MESYKNLKRSYEGFNTLVDPLQKSVRLHLRIISALLILHVGLFVGVLLLFYDPYTVRASFQWLLCQAICVFFPLTPMQYMEPDGTLIIRTAEEIYNSPQLFEFALYYLYDMRNTFLWCMAIYLLYPFFLIWTRRRGESLSNKLHVSGANLITDKQYRQQLRRNKDKTNIPCGKVKMPVSAEAKHCLMLGVGDSARKEFVGQLIGHLKKRNDKAIIYDPGGAFIDNYFDEQSDFIFNPVDSRTLGWTLTNEIDSKMDIDAITSCLLSDLNDSKDAVKAVYAGVLSACLHKKKGLNTDIYDLLSGSFPSISNALEGIGSAQKGYRYISDPTSRHAVAIFSIVAQYAKCFEMMTYNDGPFAMKDWLFKPGGMIFVNTELNAHDKLMPVLTLFLDLMCQRLLSFKNNLDHPVFYIFNDFVSLKRKNYLLRMLMASGGKGGRVFLGCHDFDQIDAVYGRDTRQLMVNNCGNHLFFKIANPVSAKISSDLIGETEFFETGRTLTETSSSMSKKREPLVFATDLMNMPLNEAVVRFSGYDPLITQF